MRLHRFFITADLSHSPLRMTEPELLHQWAKVLRLDAGDAVILCDGKGVEAKGSIVSLDKHAAMIKLDAPHPVIAEPSRSVTLYCAVLKRENFELVVQKSVEVGVKAIVPIITSRTVKTGLKMERLRMIAKEAAEQSGRGILPMISEPLEFDRALKEAKNKANLFFHTHQEAPYPSRSSSVHSVGVWVGPEGGWTEEEAQKAQDNDFSISSLGKLILRGETAAIIASYLVLEDS